MIVPAIGAFPEETKAYNLVTKLMWSLPPAVFLLSLLDWCLFFLYQKKFHFWVGIVEEDGAEDELESDEEEVFLEKNYIGLLKKSHVSKFDSLIFPEPLVPGGCQELVY